MNSCKCECHKKEDVMFSRIEYCEKYPIDFCEAFYMFKKNLSTSYEDVEIIEISMKPIKENSAIYAIEGAFTGVRKQFE